MRELKDRRKNDLFPILHSEAILSSEQSLPKFVKKCLSLQASSFLILFEVKTRSGTVKRKHVVQNDVCSAVVSD